MLFCSPLVRSMVSQSDSGKWLSSFVRGCFVVMVSLLFSGIEGAAHGAPADPEVLSILRTLDEHSNNYKDYRSDVYIETKEKGKLTLVYEASIFRRKEDHRLMLLFTKPKTSQGVGYLKVDHNLWYYDPSVGKWEHVSDRERIGKTNSRRSDYDESRLAVDYDVVDGGEAKLGARDTRVIKLRAKPDLDLEFPVIKVWIDKKNNTLVKREDYSLSGRLYRTAYFTKWATLRDEGRNKTLWYAKEVRIYDEIEKDNQLLIVSKDLDIHDLPANIFTKAWLEGKSR